MLAALPGKEAVRSRGDLFGANDLSIQGNRCREDHGFRAPRHRDIHRDGVLVGHAVAGLRFDGQLHGVGLVDDGLFLLGLGLFLLDHLNELRGFVRLFLRGRLFLGLGFFNLHQIDQLDFLLRFLRLGIGFHLDQLDDLLVIVNGFQDDEVKLFRCRADAAEDHQQHQRKHQRFLHPFHQNHRHLSKPPNQSFALLYDAILAKAGYIIRYMAGFRKKLLVFFGKIFRPWQRLAA